MCLPAPCFGLAAELEDEIIRETQVRCQDLQCHLAAKGDLLGLIDRSHAPPADLADDSEVAEDTAGLRGQDGGSGSERFVGGRRCGGLTRLRRRLSRAGLLEFLWIRLVGWGGDL
jgi:hypothetical protein